MWRSHLQLAFKVLLRRKFFTFVSLFGISFTLAVLTLGSALVDHVLAPHPPETRLDRTLGAYHMRQEGPESSRTSSPGYRFLDRYVRGLPGAEAVGIFELQEEVTGFADGRSVDLFLKRTDGAFWRILDFQLLEGRGLTDDDEANARPVAVINRSTQRRFFGLQRAEGKTLEVDGQRFQVVGVVEDVPFTRFIPFADVWVPISTSKSSAYREEFQGGFMALVLAPSPDDLPRLKAELDAITAAVEPPDRRFDTFEVRLRTLPEFLALDLLELGNPGTLFAALAALALLFMLLPALNLVNLNLSRILERASEIGVRKAFGATRRQLVGQFLVENLLLTLLGGALGLGLAAAGLSLLNRSGFIPYAQFSINARIFLEGLILALIFGVLSGAYPAWRMSRLHPVEGLKGAGR